MVSKETADILSGQMLQYFEAFSNVYPRGSKKEKKACEFLAAFAKEHGLDYTWQSQHKDGRPVDNVVIRKPGTPGYESASPVILQAHMDMVCQKNPDSLHDFDKEPIHIKKSSETYTTQDGTTLGADDGSGVACALAFLASDQVPHPPLEAVFTSDEEDGMGGARSFDTSMLKGRTLINIDSEDEGLFFYGCAGGVYANTRFTFTSEQASENCQFYRIRIDGLLGGHSGMMIDKKRANANRLMGRLLYMLSDKFSDKEFRLAFLDGGTFKNAIAASCQAVVGVREDRERLAERLMAIGDIFRHEYKGIESTMNITLEEEGRQDVIPHDTFRGIVSTLMLLPDGVTAMSNSVEGLVETSSNLGLVKKEAGKDSYVITSFIRSSVSSRKEMIVEQMRCLAGSLGGEFETDTDSPGWEPDPDSRILAVFQETYQELFGRKPEAEAVHAGLECGYFAQHYPDMDMISVGPTITGAHSPEETLYLATVPKLILLLVNVLKKLG